MEVSSDEEDNIYLMEHPDSIEMDEETIRLVREFAAMIVNEKIPKENLEDMSVQLNAVTEKLSLMGREVPMEMKEAFERDVKEMNDLRKAIEKIIKNENAHACLAEQFEKHTVFRKYVSLTCGVPAERDGRIEMSIARDPNNRVRMKAVPSSNTRYQARFAASRYAVTKELCKGGVGVVEWRLETGRTHQIRVHAQHIGFPLLGDEIYGGTKGLALSRLKFKLPSKYHGEISKVISSIERPCLHAHSLGFEHPRTGEKVLFSCPPPQDFMDVLNYLRKLKGVS